MPPILLDRVDGGARSPKALSSRVQFSFVLHSCCIEQTLFLRPAARRLVSISFTLLLSFVQLACVVWLWDVTRLHREIKMLDEHGQHNPHLHHGKRLGGFRFELPLGLGLRVRVCTGKSERGSEEMQSLD